MRPMSDFSAMMGGPVRSRGSCDATCSMCNRLISRAVFYVWGPEVVCVSCYDESAGTPTGTPHGAHPAVLLGPPDVSE
jgi:hypothetical protein